MQIRHEFKHFAHIAGFLINAGKIPGNCCGLLTEKCLFKVQGAVWKVNVDEDVQRLKQKKLNKTF